MVPAGSGGRAITLTSVGVCLRDPLKGGSSQDSDVRPGTQTSVTTVSHGSTRSPEAKRGLETSGVTVSTWGTPHVGRT